MKWGGLLNLFKIDHSSTRALEHYLIRHEKRTEPQKGTCRFLPDLRSRPQTEM
jgi:hypothetical protein